MQLLGSNVSFLRKRQPDGLLPFGAAVHLGLQMLACVEAVHAEGFIHRDIKPSNFVLSSSSGSSLPNTVASSSSSSSAVGSGGKPAKRQLYILDFGQSRIYKDERDGSVRPAREQADFRGTSLYSSLNAHLLRDLGRRDDLWCVGTGVGRHTVAAFRA